MSARLRDEEGATLVELLITIVLLGTIMSGVAAIFYVSRRAQDRTRVTLTENDDLANVSVYLQGDIQSAEAVEQDVQGRCGAGPARLALSWTDLAADVRYEADYAGSGEVVRVVCRNAGAGWDRVSRNVVAHDASITAVQPLTSGSGARGLRVTLTSGTGAPLAVAAYRRAG